MLLGLLVSPAAWAQDRFQLNDDGWATVHQAAPGTPEAELQSARRAFADGQYDDAIDLARDWINAYPNHPAQPAARLLVGDALSGKQHYYKALFEYEYLIRTYPGSAEFTTAIEREFAIATLFRNGMRRLFLGLRIISAKGEAEEIYIQTQTRVPGTPLAERALIELADYYFEEGQMFLASEAYDIFLELYPRSTRRQYATLRLIHAYLAQFKDPRYNPSALLDARQQLELFMAEYPAAAQEIQANALVRRIDALLARKQLLTARWYLRQDLDVSGAYVLHRVVQDFPGTPAAIEAAEQLETLGPVPGVDADLVRSQP